VCTDAEGQPVATLADGDVVIFFNFRADRARQLTQALAFDDFSGFTRRAHPRVSLTAMTRYDATYGLPVLFDPQSLSGSFAEVLAGRGTNLRLAETEKYAHVTFFFNGGREEPFEHERRILIPSPKVATYDLQPEMSAPELAQALDEAIRSRAFDVIICNIANPDMVGHSGSLSAAIKAVEAVDACLQQICDALTAAGGELLITADHGNVEQMQDAVSGQVHTAHTTNPVPYVYLGRPARAAASGGLRDVAPTLLYLLDLPQPEVMTGRSLLRLL
jgi:2,3-bisphosphoglycerate-independent phosphoglycerate mutase